MACKICDRSKLVSCKNSRRECIKICWDRTKQEWYNLLTSTAQDKNQKIGHHNKNKKYFKFICWNLPSIFDFFFNCGWTFRESKSNKSFQIWWISETRRLVSILRLWFLISSPQIRQSEARCRTWISVRLISLPWKEKKQRLVLMRKKK